MTCTGVVDVPVLAGRLLTGGDALVGATSIVVNERFEDVAAFPGPEYPLIRAEGAGDLDPNTRRGNSFSGPHATGVAALILSANPELPAWEVKEIMEDTALDLPPTGRDNRTGAGLIDAVEAVREALTRR